MSATAFHNPFRPTAGAEPPRIIGRDDIALEFTESLNSGIGAPARLIRVAGPRGSGKTVLLCDLRDRARELGWKTAIVSAGPNLLLDLKDQIAESSLATNASVGVNAGFVSLAVNHIRIQWRLSLVQVGDKFLDTALIVEGLLMLHFSVIPQGDL